MFEVFQYQDVCVEQASDRWLYITGFTLALGFLTFAAGSLLYHMGRVFYTAYHAEKKNSGKAHAQRMLVLNLLLRASAVFGTIAVASFVAWIGILMARTIWSLLFGLGC